MFVLGESKFECAIWMAICQLARTWSRQGTGWSSSSCMGDEEAASQWMGE